MRYRPCLSLLALAALLAVPIAPAAAAPPDPVTASASAAVSTPAVSESIHVYLLVQLEIPAALGRDSVALYAHLQHAAVAMMATFSAEQIPVARWGGLLRSSDYDGRSRPAQTDSLRPPASGYERSARRIDATLGYGVMLAALRR
jgi:hypothetical protein